jgi:hypothetical protein
MMTTRRPSDGARGPVNLGGGCGLYSEFLKSPKAGALET